MTTTSDIQNPPVQNALLASQRQKSVGEFLQDYLRRVRGGDLGPLPIVIGLVLIAILFQSQNANFLTANNFVNLILQMSALAMMAYGVVFVLLIGEIDLSIGYTSAIAGVLMTVLLRPPYNAEWFLAVGAGILAVLGIGLLQGFLITTFQLPSFIVTMAGFLAWNGVVILVVGRGGTISINQPLLRNLASSYLPPEVAWIGGIVLVVAFAALKLVQYQTRQRSGLGSTPLPIIIMQIALLAVILGAVVIVCNQDRGVPVIGVMVIIALIILTFVVENTRFGRYIFAVGGNKEAARRAGIRVERIRLYVFMISSLMAGIAGIILASRLKSVATGQGGGQLLLNSIAAAVIGGTSLFGGRGKVYSALLGALVIASVENGLGLLNIDASVQFIVTGVVLLVAVIIDSLSRRSQKRSGLV
jgi:D-xylose transport system permease protein